MSREVPPKGSRTEAHNKKYLGDHPYPYIRSNKEITIRILSVSVRIANIRKISRKQKQISMLLSLDLIRV